MEKRYKVYKHICSNGKVYVGVTCQKPEYRWDNGKGYTGSLFGKAIEKYGWDNIKHIVSKESYTKSEAMELEKKFIAEYKSNDREFGYNITAGGEGMSQVKHTEDYKIYMSALYSGEGNPMFGREVSQEHRDKISKANKGKEFSKEHRQKIAKANERRIVSDETKQKISESLKRTWANKVVMPHGNH